MSVWEATYVGDKYVDINIQEATCAGGKYYVNIREVTYVGGKYFVNTGGYICRGQICQYRRLHM